MQNSFFRIITTISLVVLTQTASAKPAVSSDCSDTTVKWDKCEADIKALKNGERISLQTKLKDDKACYAWMGKATVECKKGKLEVLKKQSSCNWDCVCCY